DEGDVAAHRLVDDRLRRRAESGALRTDQQLLERRGEVEAFLGLDEVVDQPDGELACGEADPLVGVPVDHVVATRMPWNTACLATADLGACRPLELEGDVLCHMAGPGALVQPLGEAALATA